MISRFGDFLVGWFPAHEIATMAYPMDPVRQSPAFASPVNVTQPLTTLLAAPRCGARWHVCHLGRRRLGRHRARSSRAALASRLALATMWREAARVLPRAAAAWPSPRSLYAGCASVEADLHRRGPRGRLRLAGRASGVDRLRPPRVGVPRGGSAQGQCRRRSCRDFSRLSARHLPE